MWLVAFYDPGDEKTEPFTSITGGFGSKDDANKCREVMEQMFQVSFSIIPVDEIEEFTGTGEKVNAYGMPERFTKLSLILGGKNEES